jgi:molybdopterin converting factor small subunit
VIVRLLMFATAREAAGRSADTVDVPDGTSLDAVLAVAVQRYGDTFADVLGGSGVWVNGDEPPAGGATYVHDGDEVAVLPPVSGGGASRRGASEVA